MKKMVWLVILIVLISVAGCSEKKNETVSGLEFLLEACTIEELVQNSNAAIIGEYIETIEYESYIEHKFAVKEILYGQVSDAEIYLAVNRGTAYVSEYGYSYAMGTDSYIQGKEYLLVMEKTESIMYEHDRYTMYPSLMLCESDQEYTLYSQSIEIPDNMSVKEYILSLTNSAGLQSTTENTVVYQDSIDEMIGMSEYVGTVRIVELYFESEGHNGNTYRCTVESLAKGTGLNTYDDGTILLVIMKDTVEVGETYIIGFSPVEENSRVHMQTTVNGVFEDSSELLNDISERTGK